MSTIITLSTGKIVLPKRLNAVGNSIHRVHFSSENIVFSPSLAIGIGGKLTDQWSAAYVVYDQSPRMTNNCDAENRVFYSKPPTVVQGVERHPNNPVLEALRYSYNHLPDYWVAFIFGRAVTLLKPEEELAGGIPRPEDFDPIRDELVAVVEVHPDVLP